MWLLFRHSPKLDLAKVVAWLFLPVIYFALPAEGLLLAGFPMSRMVAAVGMHLPILLAVSLVSMMHHLFRRDPFVIVSFGLLPALTTLNVVVALAYLDDGAAAQRILSLQAGAMVIFHVGVYAYPKVLRDFYIWPWARLPVGIKAAGAIRGLGHVFIFAGNETLITLVPPHVWVILVPLLPILSITLANILTVGALFAMGLRPRAYVEEQKAQRAKKEPSEEEPDETD